MKPNNHSLRENTFHEFSKNKQETLPEYTTQKGSLNPATRIKMKLE